MSNINLKFGRNITKDAGAFRLLELPPELCKLVEESTNAKLTIRGQPDEDAVLCTPERTYSLRSVVLSNSVLVVTPTSNPQDVVIRRQIHEILEPVPCLPRLQKLSTLLRGREYDEGHEEDEEIGEDEEGRPVSFKKPRFTYDDARGILQASDFELEKCLKDRRILVLNGCLRPIAPSHLTTVLEILLNALVSLSLSHENAPVEDLAASLQEEHDINRDITRQVMQWFGEVADNLWKMDVEATVREVGIGILRAHRHDSILEPQFLQKWKVAVGDTFESKVDIKLLSGNYLSRMSELGDAPVFELLYFPSSTLPSDPAARFADLFLTRPRWKAEEITPFLADIVVDAKDRDRLLLKHARAITNSEGVWYTTRVQMQ
ncbi:sister chromatid cohesion protein Dcc1 [Irpex rosettiformis]|uniref:Sister chromatid cohesion protein Dcc1 n=1 Tax=Irpex rosettiformis TaxID=378272 RepID=A0ACB8UGJ4_9APHY|nr:sister chromatid cohesion protein Dcc1 [Irpex rosettiformis]